jgi:hypothetical protein
VKAVRIFFGFLMNGVDDFMGFKFSISSVFSWLCNERDNWEL